MTQAMDTTMLTKYNEFAQQVRWWRVCLPHEAVALPRNWHLLDAQGLSRALVETHGPLEWSPASSRCPSSTASPSASPSASTSSSDDDDTP